MRVPQVIGKPGPFKRNFHVFYKRQDGSHKCVLCGCVVKKGTALPSPTDELDGWLPADGFEPLTKGERQMFPWDGGKSYSEY